MFKLYGEEARPEAEKNRKQLIKLSDIGSVLKQMLATRLSRIHSCVNVNVCTYVIPHLNRVNLQYSC